MQTDTVIVGGGLCGVSLAWRLGQAGRGFHLIEARDRLGGRILSQSVQAARFDLGPAWFWPGQPRIAALIAKLGLTWFDQYADGALVHEDAQGQVAQGRGFSSMAGSLRVAGGFGSLIDALAAKIPDHQIALSDRALRLEQTPQGIDVTTASGKRITARRVVLALPLRVASQLTYAPALSPDARQALEGTATWMAGQAKAVALYDTPFWRNAGLSGDAMSRRGPMVEIHDASPAQGGPYALFGFLGVPPQSRQDQSALKQAVLAQLVRLFGSEAGAPIDVLVKDWAFDANTSTPLDLQPLFAHPSYGLPTHLRGLWDGQLILSGTETAPEFGGYLEGALEAGDAAFARLTETTWDVP